MRSSIPAYPGPWDSLKAKLHDLTATLSDANVPFGFHVDQPVPVFTPPARYW